MTTSALRSHWLELINLGHESHRRVEGHPLTLYFGTDPLGKPVFFLITDSKPDLPRLSDAVRVERRLRTSDNYWTLLLTLDNQRLLQPFLSFCAELIVQSEKSGDPVIALADFYRTMQQWRDLLLPHRPHRLSAEELRGLYAELWTLQRRLPGVPLDAVSAWKGPLGAPQDFRLPSGLAIEVKARHPDARFVRISSVEQLDPTFSVDLRLLVLAIEDVNPDAHGSSTVLSLIQEIRSGLGGSPSAADDFESKLAALGFDESDSHYSEVAFQLTGENEYRVRDGFPRIRRAEVPAGVGNIEYTLELAALRGFESPMGTGE